LVNNEGARSQPEHSRVENVAPETSVKPLVVAEHASVTFGGEVHIPFRILNICGD
jgi:hypothetical protein